MELIMECLAGQNSYRPATNPRHDLFRLIRLRLDDGPGVILGEPIDIEVVQGAPRSGAAIPGFSCCALFFGDESFRGSSSAPFTASAR